MSRHPEPPAPPSAPSDRPCTRKLVHDRPDSAAWSRFFSTAISQRQVARPTRPPPARAGGLAGDGSRPWLPAARIDLAPVRCAQTLRSAPAPSRRPCGRRPPCRMLTLCALYIRGNAVVAPPSASLGLLRCADSSPARSSPVLNLLRLSAFGRFALRSQISYASPALRPGSGRPADTPRAP